MCQAGGMPRLLVVKSNVRSNKTFLAPRQSVILNDLN